MEATIDRKRPEKLSRSQWTRTLASYGTSQGIIAVGAFARIPLLIAHLGTSGYGTILVVSGFAVLFIAIADALAQATRSAVAEQTGLAAQRHGGFAVIANTLGWTLFGLGLVSGIWMMASDSEAPAVIPAAIWCLTGASLSILGGPAKGRLEGTGRTALATGLQSLTTLVGLPALLIVLWFFPSLELASLVTGIGLAMPYLAAIVFAGRAEFSGRRRFLHWAGFDYLKKSAEGQTVRHMLVWSWANALNYAFDAAIVAAVLGQLAAAEFGLASRVMTLAMMLSLALNPLIATQVATWRADGDLGLLLRKSRRLAIVLGGLALLVCGCAIAVGPWLARLLSDGQIRGELSLFIALGSFAALSAVTSPLMALFSGVGGSRFRASASAIAACANFVLSIVFTHLIGVSGPSVASSLALAGLSVVLLVRVRKSPASILTTFEITRIKN